MFFKNHKIQHIFVTDFMIVKYRLSLKWVGDDENA
jgi:hypothetical protein